MKILRLLLLALVPAIAFPQASVTRGGTGGLVVQQSGLSIPSPTLTGTPLSPTATIGTNTTQVATTAFVLANAGSASTLVPTAVKTSAYNAVVGDFIPVDTTGGSVTITLPTAPADKSQIAVKQVIRGGTNTVTIAAGGSDVFNKTGGGTTLTITVVNGAFTLQYKASGAIWYAISDDLPLGSLLGNANTWSATQTLTAALSTSSTAVTQSVGDNAAKIATTEFVGLYFGGATVPQTGWTQLFGTPNSSNLRAWITDDSGTGSLLFAGGNIGAATATSLNGITFTGSSTPAVTVTGTTAVSGSNTGDQNTFQTFAVAGQSNVTATTTTDTATLVAGSQVTITTSGKNITISSSGSGSPAPNSVFFSATGNGANNATASDVSIIGSGVGSKTTLANYFSAGTTLMIHVSGTIATAATPDNLTIKIKAGSTTVGSASGVGLTGLLSGSTFEMVALVTCRTAGASGTFSVNSIFSVTGSALTPLEAKLTNSGSAIDTTGTLAWDVTAAWASTTAGDIITGTNFAMWTPGQNTDDTPWASSWNGVTTQAPSKNAVYDWGHTFDTDDDGKVNVLDTGVGLANTDSGGVLQTPITAYASLLAVVSDISSAVRTATNLRVTPRIATLADAATVTIATDSFDGGILTSLSQTTTMANPTGTPTNMQVYRLRIKSSSAQTLSWDTQFRGSSDLQLPTSTTGSSKTDYFTFVYNSADTKWDLIGKNFGF